MCSIHEFLFIKIGMEREINEVDSQTPKYKILMFVSKILFLRYKSFAAFKTYFLYSDIPFSIHPITALATKRGSGGRE
jgi:hypothetical protein